MKRIDVHKLLFACLLAPMLASSAGYQITTRVKTIDRDKSEKRERLRGDTQLRWEDQQLIMSLRRMTPVVTEEALVRWVVLVEDPGGRVHTAEQGRELVSLEVGIPREIESDVWTLEEIAWDGKGPRNGAMGMSLYGSGVQLVDAQGKVLAETYSPAKHADPLRTALQDAAKREKNVPAPPPPRKIPRRLR